MDFVTVKDLEKIVEGLTWHILNLQARVDATETLVRVLAWRSGADAKKVEETLETIRATALHKRPERMEDQSPLWAARVYQRTDASGVDPKLMKMFRLNP